MNCPSEVGGARVICFSRIHERHRPLAGIAIAQYESEQTFFLFGCDDAWRTQSDSWHQTLDEAKAQAESEYEGVSKTWVTPT